MLIASTSISTPPGIAPGVRDVLVPEDLGPAGLVIDSCLHAVRLFGRGGRVSTRGAGASKAGFPGRESHPCSCPSPRPCWCRHLPPRRSRPVPRHFPRDRGASDGRRFPDALRDPRDLEDVELRNGSLVVHEMVETDPEVLRVVREAMGDGRRRGRRDAPVPPGRGAGGARRARERRDPHRREAVRRDDRTGSTSRSRPRSPASRTPRSRCSTSRTARCRTRSPRTAPSSTSCSATPSTPTRSAASSRCSRRCSSTRTSSRRTRCSS